MLFVLLCTTLYPDVYNTSQIPNPDSVCTSTLESHSLDQRKKEVIELVKEAQNDKAINKGFVEAKMGKPDAIQATVSKEFLDRVIGTTYYYDLAPGEYSFLNSKGLSLTAGGRACISFGERMTYGSHGRPYSIRDESARLETIEIEDFSLNHVFLIWPTDDGVLVLD